MVHTDNVDTTPRLTKVMEIAERVLAQTRAAEKAYLDARYTDEEYEAGDARGDQAAARLSIATEYARRCRDAAQRSSVAGAVETAHKAAMHLCVAHNLAMGNLNKGGRADVLRAIYDAGQVAASIDAWRD